MKTTLLKIIAEGLRCAVSEVIVSSQSKIEDTRYYSRYICHKKKKNYTNVLK